jgi:hypothetical protein
MEIKDFLSSLEKMNFSLSVKDGKLNLNANKNKVSREEIRAVKSNGGIISYIETHKEDLIKYLSLLPKLPSGGAKDVISIYRLSGLQEGMLFHSLYDTRQGDYIEQFVCELVNVDLASLTDSWDEVIKRHSILRTAFYYDAFNIPVQCVYRQVNMPVNQTDHRDLDPATQLSVFNDYLKADRRQGFDLKAAPLMRLTLFRLDDSRYRMAWSAHHILLDGWSLSILMGELLSVYELMVNGEKPAEYAEDKFEDYIRHLEQRDKGEEELYWHTYMGGVSEGTSLPFVNRSNPDVEVSASTLTQRLDKVLSDQVHSYAKRNHVTVNTLMQGVWSILLNKYTDNEQVVHGVVVSGRPDELPDVERRVGLFINTIPIRTSFTENRDVVPWLKQLQEEQVASRNYQYTTLQDIKQWTGMKTELFDSLLVFENYPVDQLMTAGKGALQVENVSVYEQTNFPLTILIAAADEITLTLNFNASLLNPGIVANIISQFIYVLQQITDGIAVTLREISLTTVTDQSTLKEFNNTCTNLQGEADVVSVFESQAEKTPDAVAVISGDRSFSYREVNERANQLARHLQLRGIKSGMLVPICLYRGAEMLIGILGIMKAGASYVPVDPDYPQDRIGFMLNDTDATLVLTTKKGKHNLPAAAAQIIELDTDRIAIDEHESDPTI